MVELRLEPWGREAPYRPSENANEMAVEVPAEVADRYRAAVAEMDAAEEALWAAVNSA